MPLHVKVTTILSDLKETLIFFDRLSKKYSNIKFHENPSGGSPVVPSGRTDRTKLIVVSCNLADATKYY